MNNSLAVFLIDDNIRAIKAEYEPKATPATFKTFDDTIEEGDYVVVGSNTRHEMTVVKVTSVDITVDFDDQAKVEWVVGKVDVHDYRDTLGKEEMAIEAIKAAELRKKKEAMMKAVFGDTPMDEIKAISIAPEQEKE